MPRPKTADRPFSFRSTAELMSDVRAAAERLDITDSKFINNALISSKPKKSANSCGFPSRPFTLPWRTAGCRCSRRALGPGVSGRKVS